MRYCAHTILTLLLTAIFWLPTFAASDTIPSAVDSLQTALDTITAENFSADTISAHALATDSTAIETIVADSVAQDSAASVSGINSAFSPDSLLLAQPEPKKNSQAIDAPIDYTSNDSLVLMGNGTAFLHGNGDIKYKSMELTSDFIRVKMDSSTIFARGVYDSVSNEWNGRPVFADGNDKYETNEMTYNLKTQKAFIRHVVTEQGEGYIISEKTKKVGDDVLMMADGFYTTCNDHDHPHFGLKLTKAKVKPGEYIATGPAYLVVGDVPLPLAVPFGFFPFTDKYSSGLIMPQFGDDYTRGLYMRGLGYYFAINDYFDLQITGDIYTKGTWAIEAATNYRKRYKFSGNINFAYRVDVTGEKDMPDYTKSTNMSIRWSHTQDSKANPYSTFSASVNFSTSGYNRSNINSYYDSQLNSENTKSSSISYTQRFPDSPWSISMSAMINQRTKDSTISLTLPNINVNMSNIKPFKRKKALGKEKWYEKIQMSYKASIKNSIDCKENYLLHSNFVKDWKNSITHSIPVSASFTAFKYLNISPSMNYNERWYFQRIDQSWDDHENQVVRDTTAGFYRVWDFNMSLSLSTKLYGYYIPIRRLFGDKVDRFRHVFTPSISFTYSPDCENIRAKINHNYWGSYMKPMVDKQTGDTTFEEVTYSRFGNYSVPSRGSQGTLSFNLGNNLEVKVRNDKDTTGKEPYKVISLLDQFDISGGYNFIADSMNWSNFRLKMRIKLPKNHSISLSGEFDPYMYGLNSSGRPVRINELRWNHGKFPMFLGTSQSFSYTLSNEKIKGWINKARGKKEAKEKAAAAAAVEDQDMLEDGMQPEQNLNDPFASEHSRDKEESSSSSSSDGTFMKTEIPWSITASYTVRYGKSNEFDYEKMRYKMAWTHNLSLSGNISLGKGWKVSASTSYDFVAKRFSTANFTVSRDLHCWSMSASFVPFGWNKSYTFHIGVNASMLSDLKYDKTSADSTNKKVNWW